MVFLNIIVIDWDFTLAFPYGYIVICHKSLQIQPKATKVGTPVLAQRGFKGGATCYRWHETIKPRKGGGGETGQKSHQIMGENELNPLFMVARGATLRHI